MTQFALAQTFYLDQNQVSGAQTVGISRVDLYFRQVPSYSGNKSGIVGPGCTVYISPVVNGVPSVPPNLSTLPHSRREWGQIQASGDASVVTSFPFSPPSMCPTAQSYALVVQFDGDEDFVLWQNHAGNPIVTTGVISTGAGGTTVGSLYQFSTDLPQALAAGNNVANSGMAIVGSNTSPIQQQWAQIASTDLKFQVAVGRYMVNGSSNLQSLASNTSPAAPQVQGSDDVEVVNNPDGSVTMTIRQDRFEYFTYDRPTSNALGVQTGELVYQNTVFYPGGRSTNETVAITKGGSTVTASANVNWSTLLTSLGSTPEYLVITSKDHAGAGQDRVQVRQVVQIVSNTVVLVDTPFSISNSVAFFYRTAVAEISSFKTARFFGKDSDLLIARRSSANSTIRFTRSSLQSWAITVNGTGYSNSDVVTVSGFESVSGKVLDGYAAKANVVTNGSGAITAVWTSNIGSGFVNAAAAVVTIANNTGGSTSGSGATLTPTFGSIIKTELLGTTGTGGYFLNTAPVSITVGDFSPSVTALSPPGTFVTTSMVLPYFSNDDNSALEGKVVYCDDNAGRDVLQFSSGTTDYWYELTKRRELPSWSRELTTPWAANGASCNAAGCSSNSVAPTPLLSSNASSIRVNCASNNDFSHVTLSPVSTSTTWGRYIINNDYTNENTNSGNAWARGVEVKFNLANSVMAEDFLVWSTVYVPPNTNVVCFAKIHNSHDDESFDAKDWTMLKLTGGQNVGSLTSDPSTVVERTWGFQAYPNTAVTLPGVVTTSNASTTITGFGTSWSTNATANLVVNNVILIQNALFPSDYMVTVVNSIANDTSLTVTTAVTNTGVMGQGMTVSRIDFDNQAFDYALNSNVVRYYATNQQIFDGFDTVSVKMVFTSSDGLSVPACDDVRAVAVSS